jgi:hypothetical protein
VAETDELADRMERHLSVIGARLDAEVPVGQGRIQSVGFETGDRDQGVGTT